MPLPQSVAELLAPRAVPLPIQVGVAETPAGSVLSTGISELDAVASGGIPRGRLTEIVGFRGSGRTSLLRGVVECTIADGGWVAVVDASRTLSPRDWTHVGETGRIWVIRPHDAARGAWCADVLLRSGAFALVILDSAPVLPRAIAVRLTRLARDSGAAFVVASDSSGGRGPTQLAGALRLRVRMTHVANTQRRPAIPELRKGPRRSPDVQMANRSKDMDSQLAARDSPVTRRIAVVVEKGGIHRTVEVSCALDVSRRLCAHPEVPDRRGVARRPSGGDAERRSVAGGAARTGVGGGTRSGERGTAHAKHVEHHGQNDVSRSARRLADARGDRSAGGPPPTTKWAGSTRPASSFPRGRRRNFASPDFPAPPRTRVGTLG
jgi:hypothetical protein